jgi:hypothetical protein
MSAYLREVVDALFAAQVRKGPIPETPAPPAGLESRGQDANPALAVARLSLPSMQTQCVTWHLPRRPLRRAPLPALPGGAPIQRRLSRLPRRPTASLPAARLLTPPENSNGHAR